MAERMTANCRTDSGFTLLELVVALAILSLVSLLLVEGLTFGLESWQRTKAEAERAEQIVFVRKTVGDWLRGAYPYDARLRAGPDLPLIGAENSLSLTVPMHPDSMRNDLYRLEILKTELNALQVTATPDGGMLIEESDVISEALFTGVEALAFAYLEDLGPDVSPAWVDTWENRPTAPLAIRMQITFENATPGWPDLIVRRGIDERAHCNFDPVSRLCR